MCVTAEGDPVTETTTALHVTSSRSNADYGVVRVLIQNDGADPVVGTFNNLPEGAALVVSGSTGDVTYYVTYHYNADSSGDTIPNSAHYCMNWGVPGTQY